MFSRVCVGFLDNKRTDIIFVVARGSSLKFQQSCMVTCSFLDKNLQSPQKKSVSGHV